jgi:MYXO-CTERM domain-containing protein
MRNPWFGIVLLLVPLTSAQVDAPDAVVQEILARPGQDVTFYGHIFDWDRDAPMPMNTQFPAGEADYSIGTTTRCGNPPPAPADNEACRSAFSANEQYWYSTAGFVQVKTSEEWGNDYSLFHNERGLTKDIFLDTSKTARGLYHMSADFHGWPVAACVAACWNWDPGTFQDWTVEATIWHASLGALHSNASDVPDVSEVYERGAGAYRVANGVSASIDMMSFDSTVPVVGGHTVWPFHINFTWDPDFVAAGGRIPKESSLVIEWEWYQLSDNPAGGQNVYIIGTAGAGIVWNINSGEDYPSNIVLPVRNPLDVELVFPQFIHNKLVVLSVINTPWGSYDIDPASLDLVVKDSKGSVVPFQEGTLQRVLEQSVAHAGHYQPIKPTWVWDYLAQDLKPDDYTVTVEIRNYQHSVLASTTASFTIASDGAGTATEGRSGLQSLVGNLHDGHEGTAADPNQVGAGTTSAPADGKGKDSPGPAWLALLAALGLVAVLRRRRA